ncbi:F-box domain-containing protein [Mycena sanguinolenta]|uniref:F-box domain-containing protein n=1 Tax=Mycena sanguinolenta TaxID=230812 RepID=A0A8H6ZGA6_9AGAR|nr:F-box domain-containing protein [Mycena sanguinolenta]
MRSSTAFPLNDDIIGHILRFCADFETLQAAIHSISRQVAYNLVGPALPQALRVVRYPYFDNCKPEDDPSAMAAACPEDSNVLEAINFDKQAMLDENARAVEKLEDLYSLMDKDRTSKTSVLTAEESCRFCCAMYRLMLYCNIFYSYDYNMEHGQEYDDEEYRRAIIAQRTAVLSVYSTNELRQMYSALQFLTEIASTLSSLRARRVHSTHGRTAPMMFSTLLGEIWAEGFLDTPFENIWSARKVTAPPSKSLTEGILDSVNNAGDLCSQCDTTGTIYSTTTWCLFPVKYLLKDNLLENPLINRYFEDVVDPRLNSPAALERFIGALFALRTGEFAFWDPADLYCFECFTEFLQNQMWVWMLKHAVRYGWTPPENCPYGWDCEQQTYDEGHANVWNHLCEPVDETLQDVDDAT